MKKTLSSAPLEKSSKTKITCVFVHGWAMNSSIWEDVIDHLPSWIDVISIDLPGHGTMNELELGGLDEIARTLAAVSQRPALWVGWSLGGLALLQLCHRYPEKVGAAVLVASNPCFVSQPNWPHAVEKSVFNQFASDLAVDQNKTIKRFLALQVKGQNDAIKTVRRLHESMQQRGEASQQALTQGLTLLEESNLCDHLSGLNMPLQWVFGSRDALVPASVSKALEFEFGQKNIDVYDGAGHAPFLNDTNRFISRLLQIAESIAQRSQ